MNKLFILSILILSSCTNNSKNKKFVLNKTITFNTEMSSSRLSSGIFKDKKTSIEYFYFGNTTTDKEIKVFTQDAKLKHTIPLDSVLSLCGSIDGLKINTLDSIVVIGKFNNKLFVINRKGEVWRSFNLNNRIKHPNKDKYIYEASFKGEFLVDNNKIILASSWKSEHLDTIKRNYVEMMKHYMHNFWKSSSLVRINNIYDDSTDFKFGFNKYQHLFPQRQDALYGELNSQTIQNNFIFSWSVHSNILFKININTLEIEKEIEILANNFEIGSPLEDVNEKNLSNYGKTINNNAKSSGIISKVLYDDINHLYYVAIYTKINLDWYNGKRKNRPWVLIVYNENFKKLDEYSFENKDVRISFVSDKGLFLKKTNTKKIQKYTDQTESFEIYTYEE